MPDNNERARPNAAIAARQAAALGKVHAVEQAIRALARAGLPISRAAVAKRAQVSRTFLYENDAAAALIDAALTRTTAQAQVKQEASDDAHTASWRERALNAEAALKKYRSDPSEARREIADLLGELRDPDGTWLREDRDRLRAERDTLVSERNQLRQELRRAETQRDSARSAADRLRQSNVHRLFPNGPGAETDPDLGREAE